ncbi:helix-turn-helix domain-containing protein [Streptomyces drozdowiczii]|uniref:helix-turn-helix domain-containing protein n=1 Tax=Streptomyces drozdowiczii TaxID=202862 RepID=UPI00403C35EF
MQKPPRTYLKGEARLAVAIDLKRRYEAGATIRDLAEQTGRSASAVSALLQFAGTRMRPNHPAAD